MCTVKFRTIALRRRQWHPTPALLPGKSHGQRSLVGHSPWGCKESDTTEQLSSDTHKKFSSKFIWTLVVLIYVLFCFLFFLYLYIIYVSICDIISCMWYYHSYLVYLFTMFLKSDHNLLVVKTYICASPRIVSFNILHDILINIHLLITFNMFLEQFKC